MIKQILLTALVAVIAVLVIQARRRVNRGDKPVVPPSRFSPQAIAGWVLLALMVSAAIGAAFLHGV